MLEINLNYYAVLGAALAGFFLGALWYAPFVFGKIWVSLLGKSPEEMKKQNSAKAIGINFICSIITAYVLALAIFAAGAADWVDGIQVAGTLWLGFLGTYTLSDVTFAGRPFKLYLLNSGYQLTALVLMSLILTRWV